MLFTLIASVVGCEALPEHDACGRIPEGGCPVTAGDACIDRSCAAVYACSGSGAWVLDHACTEPRDGALDAAAQDGTTLDSGDEDASRPPSTADAGIDAPPGAWGGSGCEMLQPPDCMLATALACPASSCCDCVDLFVCDSGGWVLWGECSGAGVLTKAH